MILNVSKNTMQEIRNLSEINQIVEKQLGVLAYFYNNDCAPCISLRPKVEALVKDEFPMMKMVWINSKQTPEIPAAFQIFANPTILLFFDGKETRRFSKYVSVIELEETISRYYRLIFEQ
jgi:thioredoxin-like negative regulator of GroEL